LAWLRRDPVGRMGRSTEFALPSHLKVEFGKVSPRTAISIALLTVLLAGLITPAGVCAFMCARHLRAEAHQRCGEDTDSMAGMGHDHSAMHHTSIGNVPLVVEAQSCQTDCATAERLSISIKVIPQVTVVQTGTVVLDTTFKFLAPHLQSAWSLDSGPPSVPPARTSSYSVLRI
jgi:hypothetical protein